MRRLVARTWHPDDPTAVTEIYEDDEQPGSAGNPIGVAVEPAIESSSTEPSGARSPEDEATDQKPTGMEN